MMGVQHKVVGIGAGIAGAILVVELQGDPLGSLVAFTSVAGAMLPDIDHDRTKLGRKRKAVTKLSGNALTAIASIAVVIAVACTVGAVTGVMTSAINLNGILTGCGLVAGVEILRRFLSNSKTFKWMAKHRGFMHTTIPMLGIYIVMNMLQNQILYYMLMGVLIGYGSHLYADMLTVDGCPILFPISKHNFRILKLVTSSNACWVAAVASAGGFIYLALQIVNMR